MVSSDIDIPIDFAWWEATMMAAVRITVFLMIAPPFSHGAIPARVKAMLGIGLALAIGTSVAPGYRSLDTGPFLGALVLQLVTGALLGFLVMGVFAAVQAAGNLIDVFGGFQLAQAFDPQSMINGAQFTRLFQLIAVVLLFASDGYQLIIAGLARSFTAIPIDGVLDMTSPGGSAAGGPLALLTGIAGQLLLAAVQIAGPLALVLFLADVGLGLITRVAPALNAFALGFPLKILLTLALVGAVIVTLPGIVASLADDAFRMLAGLTAAGGDAG